MDDVIVVAAFGLAAGVGTLVRLAARRLSHAGTVPLGTLLVNLAGSFALGVVADWSAPAATVVGVAGLGAVTTYSTFADEVVSMWAVDRRLASIYLVVSVAGGAALAWLGLTLGPG